jgi:hypothetical protein
LERGCLDIHILTFFGVDVKGESTLFSLLLKNTKLTPFIPLSNRYCCDPTLKCLRGVSFVERGAALLRRLFPLEKSLKNIVKKASDIPGNQM